MRPSDAAPTREQAYAVVSTLPDLLAMRPLSHYYRAAFAGYLIHELIDNGLVCVGAASPPWAPRRWYEVDPSEVGSMDVEAIRWLLTYEVLKDEEVEGRFADFAYGPLMPVLLCRLAALYGLEPSNPGSPAFSGEEGSATAGGEVGQ